MFGLTPFNHNNVVQNNNKGVTDFYNAIDDFFNDSFLPFRSLRDDTFKVDIKETDKAYLIEAEMPGVKKEEINLDYRNDSLIIAVQRNEEVNEEKENYVHRERRMSSMQRSVYLRDINEEGIEAKLEDGVLKVNVPKQESTQNPKRRIEIQ